MKKIVESVKKYFNIALHPQRYCQYITEENYSSDNQYFKKISFSRSLLISAFVYLCVAIILYTLISIFIYILLTDFIPKNRFIIPYLDLHALVVPPHQQFFLLFYAILLLPVTLIFTLSFILITILIYFYKVFIYYLLTFSLRLKRKNISSLALIYPSMYTLSSLVLPIGNWPLALVIYTGALWGLIASYLILRKGLQANLWQTFVFILAEKFVDWLIFITLGSVISSLVQGAILPETLPILNLFE